MKIGIKATLPHTHTRTQTHTRAHTLHQTSSFGHDHHRAVAERALAKINFREEDEKLNVWAAFLQLEQNFGSEDSLQKLWRRALASNDEGKIRLRYVDVLVSGGPSNYAAAEKMLEQCAKKR